MFPAGNETKRCSSVNHSAKAIHHQSLHKKCSFPLRISSANVTKTTGNCGFGHIY